MEGPGLFGPGNIDTCWSRTDTSEIFWRPGVGPTRDQSSGPVGDHTTGTGTYMTVESEVNTPTLTTHLLTPWIDLSSATNPTLQFYLHQLGYQTMGINISIRTSPTGGWVSIGNYTGSQNYSSDPWEFKTTPLTSYAGDTVQLRIRGQRAFSAHYRTNTSIDDISIVETTSCAAPNSLNVQARTVSSITLNWFSTNSGSSFDLKYVKLGDPLTSALTYNVASAPSTVSGLQPSTSYLFWVRDSCSSGDTSRWIGPVLGTTACGTITAPYFEGFEGADFVAPQGLINLGTLHPCWVRNPNVSNSFTWASAPGGILTSASGTEKAHSGGRWLRTTGTYTATNGSAIVRTPRIDISSLANPELRFWTFMYGQGVDSLKVDVVTPGNAWVNMLTLRGNIQTHSDEAWSEQIIDLSSFAGGEIFVRFIGYRDASLSIIYNQIDIDDISIDEAPPCPRPTPLTVLNVFPTTVTVNWGTSGTAPWQIEYGAKNFAPGTGTRITSYTNPYTITGLSADTEYDIYVRDTCGVLGVSIWTGPVTVKTDCSPISTPYTENFDDASWMGAGYVGYQGTLKTCWNSPEEVSRPFWTPSPPAIPVLRTGPDYDHTSGTGDYVYFESIQASSPSDSSSLTTPLIDLSSLTIPELTFWYHMKGNRIQGLNCYVSDGASWQKVWGLSGEQQQTTASPWKEAVVNLSAYASDTIRLMWVASRRTNGLQSRIALDDVDVHEQPPCPQPQYLQLNNPTLSSLTVEWDTVGGSSWIIEYGNSGFTLGTGSTVSATSSPYVLSGLASSTEYDVYVYNSCGSLGNSTPAGVSTLATLCGPISAPYYQSFDGSSWGMTSTPYSNGLVAPCWTFTDTIGFMWKVMAGETYPSSSGPSTDHTSGTGNYLGSVLASGTNLNTYVTMPAIDLTPLDSPMVSFWYHMYGGDISALRVQIKPAGGTWSMIQPIIGEQHTSASQAWTQATIDLAAYINQSVELRFWAQKNTGYGRNVTMAVDDILIDEKTNCSGPTAASTRPISATSIEVSWTGGASGYSIIEYGPAGFTLGSGSTITVQSNPYILTGLQMNTAYDFYVRDSCSTGDLSAASVVASGSTFPCADACMYKLRLIDTGNDGWGFGATGRAHFIDVNVNGVITSYSLYSGSLKEIDIPICDSMSYSFSFRNASIPTLEVGFQILDPSGTLLYSQPTGVYNISSGIVYTGTGSCNPVCQDPVGLTVININPTNAVGIWSSISGNSWIDWGPTGYTPTAPNQRAISNGRATITGLAQNTTYDVYIQDTCDNGLMSGWVGPVTFTTLNCAAPTASFTSTVNGLVADFSGAGSSANSEIFSWDYGDGTTGSAMNNSHTYAAPGIYTVVLTVHNPCGQTRGISKQIVVCGTPSAAFTSSENGLNITLNAAASTGFVLSYDWDYGDGNIGTGSTASHTYSTDGVYTVILQVTDTCGSVDTSAYNIEVCSLPVPSFTTAVTGTQVDVDASASTGAVSYWWDFGDGNTATGITASNVYAIPDNYNVILYVENACGDTLSDTVRVSMCQPPKASWTYNIISSGGSGMLVQFDATASTGSNYYWDFGDGNTATGTNFPTHTYTTPGTFYRVTLIVENDCGQTDTMAYKLNQIGITEVTTESLKLYPNPTTGLINIQTTGLSGEVELVLTHMSGKVIDTRKVTFEGDVPVEYTFDPSLENGTYIFYLRQGQYNRSIPVVLLR